MFFQLSNKPCHVSKHRRKHKELALSFVKFFLHMISALPVQSDAQTGPVCIIVSFSLLVHVLFYCVSFSFFGTLVGKNMSELT